MRHRLECSMNEAARKARAFGFGRHKRLSPLPEPTTENDRSHVADSDRLASTSCYHALTQHLEVQMALVDVDTCKFLSCTCRSQSIMQL